MSIEKISELQHMQLSEKELCDKICEIMAPLSKLEKLDIALYLAKKLECSLIEWGNLMSEAHNNS